MYNAPIVLHLDGELSRSAMHHAVCDLMARHEALRTVFPQRKNGIPCQEVLSDGALVVPMPVLRVGEDEMPTTLAGLSALPFDLAVEPPLRAYLVAAHERRHTLLLVVHQIAFDGGSYTPLLRDLATAYRSRLAGKAPQWTPLRVQYADYALWERCFLGESSAKDSVAGRQVTFWRKALAGIPDEALPPTDYRRPDVASGRSGTYSLSCSPQVHLSLMRLAAETRTTLFMIIQAAVAVLLSRAGAGDVIPIGSLVERRPDEDFEDLIGNFVNTVVLPTDTSGNPSFRELMSRVRATDLAAWSHADLPFGQLVAALNPPRSTDRHPLFQVMVTVDEALPGGPDLPGLQTRFQTLNRPMANIDLMFSLSVHHDPGRKPRGFEITVGYSTDLYAPRTARELAQRLARLLGAVAEQPDLSIGSLPLVDPATLQARVVDFNATHADLPIGTLHELFTQQAARTPHAPAIQWGHGRLTYAELDLASDKLAARLIGWGARPDDAVALFFEWSPEFCVSVLAVLKVGATYVPLNNRQPADQLAWEIQQTKADLLLTDCHAETVEFAGEARVILVPEVSQLAASAGVPDVTARPTVQQRRVGYPDQLAYVMYSSGTTGQPKGITITHRNVADFALDPRWDCGYRRRFLAYSPLGFDSSTLEMWVPLLRGGSLILWNAEVFDVDELREVIARYQVTSAFFTTALFDMLARIDVSALAGLREIMTGGDVLSVLALRRVLDQCPDTTVVHAYGPTETTVASGLQIFGPDRRVVAGVHLGRPTANTALYVLDCNLNVTPTATVGELYIEGTGLARGYLHRPEATAERFVANPYGPAGSRMYRTGDLARWNHDGRIEFCGRADRQVKVHGFRVELADVERTLADDPQVGQVAVAALEDAQGNKRLVAYAVPAVRRTLNVVALRRHAEAFLPKYMVPSTFVILNALPLTPNGKLDRRALTASNNWTAGSLRKAPGTAQEWVLRELFAEVLGLASVGVQESFFNLGGHSLGATALVSRIRSTLGIDVTIRDLFANPTAAGLARVVDRAAATRPPIVPVKRPALLPLSFAQQRLKYLDEFDGPSPTRNIRLALRLSGSVDFDAMRAAMYDTVHRHEILRTLYRTVDGKPSQVVLDIRSVPEFWTISDCGPGEVAGQLNANARYYFDLSAELPLRVWLYRTAPAEQTLMLVLHHIAADGWSLDLLLRDIASAYAARVAGIEPSWDPLPVQYVDYTIWQRDRFQPGTDSGLALDQQLAFWVRELDGLPECLRLPLDRPRPTVSRHRAGSVNIRANQRVHRGLIDLAQEHGATLFMVLQAVFAAMLTQSGAGTDIPIGTPLAGRVDSALHELVGFFVNTLLLRVDTSADPTFIDLVRRVRKTNLRAYNHQDVPFELIVQQLNPARSPSQHPLFQVMFTFGAGRSENMWNLLGVETEVITLDVDPGQFDLTLSLGHTRTAAGEPAGIRGALEYDADIFSRATAEAMAERLVTLFERVVADPRRPLSRIGREPD